MKVWLKILITVVLSIVALLGMWYFGTYIISIIRSDVRAEIASILFCTNAAGFLASMVGIPFGIFALWKET